MRTFTPRQGLGRTVHAARQERRDEAVPGAPQRGAIGGVIRVDIDLVRDFMLLGQPAQRSGGAEAWSPGA